MRTARLILVLALAVVTAVVAGCGGASGPADSASGGTGGTPTRVPATGGPATSAPAGSDEPAVETDDPAGEPTGEPATEPPTADATEEPATPESSGSTSGAEACSGSDDNRSFFAKAADAVDWPVLCAVLPKGWFVSQGSYRKADGGKLLISYKGPGGATLSLSEGSFCASGDDCVPAGGEIGDAALGSLGGTLVGLDDGGFAIVVDRGLRPSWLLVTQGLDQPTTLALGDAMVEVGG